MRRHLWVLAQVGMLARYAFWYGFAPVVLCTAWDANPQETVEHGLTAAALLLGGAYLALCWHTKHCARAGRTRSGACQFKTVNSCTGTVLEVFLTGRRASIVRSQKKKARPLASPSFLPVT